MYQHSCRQVAPDSMLAPGFIYVDPARGRRQVETSGYFYWYLVKLTFSSPKCPFGTLPPLLALGSIWYRVP